MKKFSQPIIVHETACRLRLRWKKFMHPHLDPNLFEAWLETNSGIEKARINPRAWSLVVVYDKQKIEKGQICALLQNLPDRIFSRQETAPSRRRAIDIVFAVGLATLLPFLPPIVQRPIAWIMGLPAIVNGLRVLLSKGLKVQVLDMTTIGISLLRDNPLTAASISAMVVVGEYLRQATEDRSHRMLKSLMNSPVQNVWILQNGVEVEVPYAEVRPGALVLVGAGELVPIDGVVQKGHALLDQSSITGEAESIPVGQGQDILSGSIVLEGRLVILARKTGDQTNIARISTFIQTMIQEKSPREKQSERLADLLAPLTLGIGFAIYALTRDFQRSLAVLSIDYACAVKLPTPIVIKGSMYAASREGVFIKSGTALENFAKVDTVVFDKTGTLSEGKMEVTDILSCSDLSEDELLRLCASVEERYAHPIGKAIVDAAHRKNLTFLPVEHSDLTVAHGISAVVEGKTVRVGSQRFLAKDVDCSPLAKQLERLRKQGKSIVLVTVDERLFGVVALRDTIRLEAASVLRKLKKSGVKKIVVLSGDYEQSVRALQEKLLEIDEVQARLLPEEKAHFVKKLQKQGARVAVVGDGINDAPAFSVADVAISMSDGMGVTRETAQVVLLKESLEGLLVLRRVSERAARILSLSFSTGVAVNSGLMLGATLGAFSPVGAALVHNFTTFTILLRGVFVSGRKILEDK